MANGSIPPQHYLPVMAHHKICKLVAKLGFKLRPSGPNALRKAGGKGRAIRGGKGGRGGKR